MFLRTSSAVAALALLAACGDVSPAPSGETIECAIGAGTDFASVCTLERVAGKQEIILHHPDGGFRRMTYVPATGTLAPLDGADPLVLEEGEGVVQFALGANRYRIPRGAQQDPAPTPTP